MFYLLFLHAWCTFYPADGIMPVLVVWAVCFRADWLLDSGKAIYAGSSFSKRIMQVHFWGSARVETDMHQMLCTRIFECQNRLCREKAVRESGVFAFVVTTHEFKAVNFYWINGRLWLFLCRLEFCFSDNQQPVQNLWTINEATFFSGGCASSSPNFASVVVRSTGAFTAGQGSSRTVSLSSFDLSHARVVSRGMRSVALAARPDWPSFFRKITDRPSDDLVSWTHESWPTVYAPVQTPD